MGTGTDVIWIAGVALALVGGWMAGRLGRSAATIGSPGQAAPFGGRLPWYGLALGCTGAASWLLPGVLGTGAPWVWGALSYAVGLSADRTTSEPGPTGRAHGEHAPYRRDVPRG